MKLNLREIICIPGSAIPFSYELDPSGLSFDGVLAFQRPLRAEGKIENRAGTLTLTARIEADMHCECARCLKEIQVAKTVDIQEQLGEDEEQEDVFRLQGDQIDLDEIIRFALILEMDARFLCEEACKGLCEICGANLNNGPCGCKKIDPRFAILEELL